YDVPHRVSCVNPILVRAAEGSTVSQSACWGSLGPFCSRDRQMSGYPTPSETGPGHIDVADRQQYPSYSIYYHALMPWRSLSWQTQSTTQSLACHHGCSQSWDHLPCVRRRPLHLLDIQLVGRPLSRDGRRTTRLLQRITHGCPTYSGSRSARRTQPRWPALMLLQPLHLRVSSVTVPVDVHLDRPVPWQALQVRR
ncbi:hypothetical protein BN1708_004323, partial [Verticillium longisporum]